MQDYRFWLIKFGQLNHLKDLQDGCMYLTHVERYRNDDSPSRGDNREGKHPVAPPNFDILNYERCSIFSHIPRPDTVTLGLSGDEDILMFCASILDSYSLEITSKDNETVRIKESYLSELQSFGDYGLIFSPKELDYKVKRLYEERKILYGSTGPIEYLDKGKSYLTEAKNHIPKVMREYYFKDLKYEKQNEWRVILDGVCEKRNDDGDCLINIGKFEYSILLPIKDLCKVSFHITGGHLALL